MKTPLQTTLLAAALLACLTSCSSPFKSTQSPVLEAVRARSGLVQGPDGSLLRSAMTPSQPESPAVQFYR